MLGEFVTSDLESVHACARDSVATQFMTWGPNTVAETRSFLERCQAAGAVVPRVGYEWAITLGSGELIGGGGIGPKGTEAQQGHLGYILHPAYWGLGYATEAAKRIVAFGFGQLGLHRIWSDCVTENLGSVHVIEKCGMTREGRLRHLSRRAGVWRDHFVYAVLEDEFTSTGSERSQVE